MHACTHIRAVEFTVMNNFELSLCLNHATLQLGAFDSKNVLHGPWKFLAIQMESINVALRHALFNRIIAKH